MEGLELKILLDLFSQYLLGSFSLILIEVMLPLFVLFLAIKFIRKYIL